METIDKLLKDAEAHMKKCDEDVPGSADNYHRYKALREGIRAIYKQNEAIIEYLKRK